MRQAQSRELVSLVQGLWVSGVVVVVVVTIAATFTLTL
jgi:hypothetical protein